MEPTITSTRNPLVRRFREAAAGEPPEVLLAEGVQLVWEGLEADLPVVEAAFSERVRAHDLGRDVLRRLERDAPELHACAPAVMDRLSALKTSPGVAVVFRRPALLPDALLGEQGPALMVVAAGVRDPGNLGSLVRTAEAAGATGLWAVEGGADPYREKAVRAAAGSLFRLPTLGDGRAPAIAAAARHHGLQLVVADGGGDGSYLDVDWRRPTALVLGPEVGGVPGELLERADARVRIPMAAPVESLNVAVAAGVVLFEARRQRT